MAAPTIRTNQKEMITCSVIEGERRGYARHAAQPNPNNVNREGDPSCGQPPQSSAAI